VVCEDEPAGRSPAAAGRRHGGPRYHLAWRSPRCATARSSTGC